jgi:nucleoid DNA-binding protein
METISKKQIIESVAEEHDMTQADVERVLNSAFDAIVAHMAQGNEVSIPQIGKFTSSNRKVRG